MDANLSQLTVENFLEFQKRWRVLIWVLSIDCVLFFFANASEPATKWGLLLIGICSGLVSFAYLSMIPEWNLIRKVREDAKQIAPKMTELFELLETRDQHMELLAQRIDAIESGFGDLIYSGPSFSLYELFLDTDSGNGGSIRAARAFFVDNTRINTYTSGSTTNTKFNYQRDFSNNEDFLDNADSETEYDVEYQRTGSASVSVEGPDLIPVTLLFEDPADALQFTNLLNLLAAKYSENKKKDKRLEVNALKAELADAENVLDSKEVDVVLDAFKELDPEIQDLLFGENFELLRSAATPNNPK